MEQDKDFTRPLLVHWVSKRIITIYWESIHMSLTVEADKGLRYIALVHDVSNRYLYEPP